MSIVGVVSKDKGLFKSPLLKVSDKIRLRYHGLSEKAIAPHSSTLAWKIPWMKEPGRLQSMGLLGVGND